MTHICVSNLTIIGSGNGLSPGRRQAIIWTNAGILLIGPLGTNVSENLIKIHIFSFKKVHWKMSSGKWCPYCLSLNVLNYLPHSYLPGKHQGLQGDHLDPSIDWWPLDSTHTHTHLYPMPPPDKGLLMWKLFPCLHIMCAYFRFIYLIFDCVKLVHMVLKIYIYKYAYFISFFLMNLYVKFFVSSTVWFNWSFIVLKWQTICHVKQFVTGWFIVILNFSKSLTVVF